MKDFNTLCKIAEKHIPGAHLKMVEMETPEEMQIGNVLSVTQTAYIEFHNRETIVAENKGDGFVPEIPFYKKEHQDIVTEMLY